MSNEKITIVFTDAELQAVGRLINELAITQVLTDSVYLSRGLRKIVVAAEEL